MIPSVKYYNTSCYGTMFTDCEVLAKSTDANYEEIVAQLLPEHPLSGIFPSMSMRKQSDGSETTYLIRFDDGGEMVVREVLASYLTFPKFSDLAV